MTGLIIVWPETHAVQPPQGDLYRSATWLLGRHPRLARLVARVRGLVGIEEGKPTVDLDHLADALCAIEQYHGAWAEYECRHRPPGNDDDAYEAWIEAGPKAEMFTGGLSDILVMSSGEIVALRLLATLAPSSTLPPFGISDIHSLDDEGQRLVEDWCAVVRSH